MHYQCKMILQFVLKQVVLLEYKTLIIATGFFKKNIYNQKGNMIGSLPARVLEELKPPVIFQLISLNECQYYQLLVHFKQWPFLPFFLCCPYFYCLFPCLCFSVFLFQQLGKSKVLWDFGHWDQAVMTKGIVFFTSNFTTAWTKSTL